jgi:hypothetical protein
LARDGLLSVSVPFRHDVKRRLKTNDWNAPRNTKNHLIAMHPMEHINSWEGDSLELLARQFGLKPARFELGKQRVIGTLGSPKASSKALLRPIYHHWKSNREDRLFVKVE